MPSPTTRSLPLLASVAAAAFLGGCIPGYRPGGSQASDETFTFESTSQIPKTVRLVDWTTNTTLWTLEVPVDKELVVKFYDDHDPKNVNRPALMRWEIFDLGWEFGELHNAIPAPDATHRRLEWDVRKAPAAAPPPEPAAPARK